jgi:hypothetical protein
MTMRHPSVTLQASRVLQTQAGWDLTFGLVPLYSGVVEYSYTHFALELQRHVFPVQGVAAYD